MSTGELTRAALLAGGAAVCAWLLGLLSAWLVELVSRRRYELLLAKLSHSCRRPWRITLLVSAELIVLPHTAIPDPTQAVIRHGLVIALIAACAWLFVKALFVLEDATFRRLPVDVPDNRRMRRARTQIGVLRRLTAVAVILVAAGSILVTFQPLRAFGASLLASAGFLSVVAALAARTTLGHVFAGLQLVFTDALRIDDVVVVENNEWGRIEELRLTYVVVRLWDERRLVLPTTYFTTTPFQNWTRNEARVVASVNLYLDYTMPITPLREEARRIIEASPLWARHEWVLQVVDTTEKTMVIQVLADAADGPSAFDLKCEIREQLIAFLRTHYPQCLPGTRISLPQS
ncbi:mechanosensitive ion channel protein MscS [Rhizocola hellebori]|uniref:Mechanosensitive ion channel protein MscS n=1 Tax=Rhizocola hellebori TaxID=1392758 RepID=A0A8J3Q3U5_9ACTN|nr:mechanosensitive ion channel family protein [Rhizocola hellebori]GIH02843.1 mechanosensitive ion channel protein MscS [Rhizocola hellebori]